MKKVEETELLKEVIIQGLLDNKGLSIKSIDLRKIEHSIAKYFIICTGTSNTHVDSLSHLVEKFVQDNIGQKVWRKEGLDNSQWVILDYVDIVVHIFQQQYRDFYGLESLWADAPYEITNKE